MFFGKRFHHKGDNGCCHPGHLGKHDCQILSECQEDSKVVIVKNLDKKTVEMGLFCGMNVTVIKNDPGDPNIIVSAGDSRYILGRDIASGIRVK